MAGNFHVALLTGEAACISRDVSHILERRTTVRRLDADIRSAGHEGANNVRVPALRCKHSNHSLRRMPAL